METRVSQEGSQIRNPSCQGDNWELGIRRHPLIFDDGTWATGNFDAWPNGLPVLFTVVYDGSRQVTATLSYLLANTLVSSRSTHTVADDFSDLFLLTRAERAHARIQISNLFLDGLPVGASSSAIHSGAAAQDVLRIQGGSLADGFILTGTITMAWTGPRPNNSQLDLEIWGAKVSTAPPPDTTPPTVTITAPAEAAFLNTPEVLVTGTVTDDGEVASVTVNDLEVTLAGVDFQATVALQEGFNEIFVVATDGTGKQSFATRTVTLDRTPPSLTVEMPSPGQLTWRRRMSRGSPWCPATSRRPSSARLSPRL